jgi:NADPH:quinone reductase-like Zn-dependent oxidoreductase
MTMATAEPTSGLELRSLVTAEGVLEISLVEAPRPEHTPSQVVVRVEAAPVNPSDLGLLLAGADIDAASFEGSAGRPLVRIPVEERAMRSLAGRVGKSLPVGNEGAGVVVAAGADAAAQGLLGRVVAIAGGAMYAEYRCVEAAQCLALPEGMTPKMGASSFVNPMTTLGMVGTMRNEGHSALIHTAAASNLGQMLVKLCDEEHVALVNIVRKPEHEELLRSIGATHVCNSTAPSFMQDLIEAIGTTGATIAFDAVGGGPLASQILTCMEAASVASMADYSRYGSTTHKQVYIYGGLDTSPTVLTRSFGFAWGLGGWLVSSFLQGIAPEEFQALRQRVVAGLPSTFASTYTREVSLAEALMPDSLAGYSKKATGEKYLVTPWSR